jgi:hypothetical protein
MGCYLSIVKIETRRNGWPADHSQRDSVMTKPARTQIAAFRIVEDLMDRVGLFMLLVLGLATAGATVAAGL